mgnify:CR=1 FL=1
MPSQGVWGPPIWNFLHTLAEKIREDRYPELGSQLVNFIQRVATHLPCPDCSQHASRFFKNAPPGAFNTKQKLKESLKKPDIITQSSESSLSVPLKEARENFEKEYLTTQLKKFNGNISKTADFIGMERSALHRKLKSLHIKGLN